MLRLHPSTVDYVILGIYFVVVLARGRDLARTRWA
jgi:hypothetical protein